MLFRYFSLSRSLSLHVLVGFTDVRNEHLQNEIFIQVSKRLRPGKAKACFGSASRGSSKISESQRQVLKTNGSQNEVPSAIMAGSLDITKMGHCTSTRMHICPVIDVNALLS